MLSVLLAGCTTFDTSDIQTPQGQAAFVIARKEILKQLRSYMARQVRDEFKQDPSMRLEQYEARLSVAQAFGRVHREGSNAADLSIREVRNITLKRPRNAEDPVELIQWGPLYADDEGSIKLNLSALYSHSKTKSTEALLLPGLADEEHLRQSDRWGDNWDTSIRARVNVNPLRAVIAQDINEIVRSYGAILTFTYSSDILHRKIFDIECEGKISNQGEPAFFLNFVFPLR
jgi:hypothetical protein